MPKFLYTIIGAALLFTGLTLHVLFNTDPDFILNKFAFLIYFFLGLVFSGSLFFYFTKSTRLKTMEERKSVYREALKKSVFYAFIVILILGLKIFRIFSF